MNNKLTTFAFYFWSADAEDQNKKIPEYWLLEYSTTYFFLLERDKPGAPVAAGAVLGIFVLCISYTSCLFSLGAHHPYLLIP